MLKLHKSWAKIKIPKGPKSAIKILTFACSYMFYFCLQQFCKNVLLARAGSIILQIAFLMQNRSDPILDGSMCESNMFCRAKCISNKGQGATRHLGRRIWVLGSEVLKVGEIHGYFRGENIRGVTEDYNI